MQVKERGDLVPAHPAHPAFGADAPVPATARAGRQGRVDELHLIAARTLCLLGRVIGHQREIQLGARIRSQPGQRREVALLALILRHGEGDEAHRPPGRRRDRVQHPDLQGQ